MASILFVTVAAKSIERFAAEHNRLSRNLSEHPCLKRHSYLALLCNGNIGSGGKFWRRRQYRVATSKVSISTTKLAWPDDMA